MKLLTIVALALTALVSADVSHLERSYLPPSRTTTFSASHGYSTDHGGISAIGEHKEKLVAAPVLVAKSHQHVHSAPAHVHEAHLASPVISPSLSSYASSSNQVHKSAPLIHQAHTAPVAVHQAYLAPVAVGSTSYASGGHHKAPLGQNHASHHTTASYVAPTQHVTHHQIHDAPIVHHDFAAPVITHQAYSSPLAIESSSHGSDGQHKTQLGHITSNYIAPVIAPVHHVVHQQTHHSAPAKQVYTTSHHAAPASSYSNFNSFTTPALDKHITHSAPAVVQHYATPAVSHAYSPASGKYTAPSVGHNYISPAAALETFSKSLGHKTYADPSHSHSDVLSVRPSANGYDTKYGANGGYVY